MRKVFHDCYRMDRRCHDEYKLSQEILVEHAAIGMAQFIQDNYSDKKSILIIAGAGNNGADGIALARLLQFHVEEIRLYLPFELKSQTAQLQYNRVKNLGYIHIVDQLSNTEIVVDALFGAGINRSFDYKTECLVNEMNDLGGIKIACDMPSGVSIDATISHAIFCADVTLTMGALKELLFYDHIKDMAGDITRIDLGVRYDHYTKGASVASYLLEPEDIVLPSRDFSMDTHKGSFGHVAVLCGDHQGAGIMAGMSASRFGAGLVTLVSKSDINPPVYLMHSHSLPTNTTAVAIGMGLGRNYDNEAMLQSIIDSHTPVVLDADSFYNSQLLELIGQRDREIVLTPHPKEFVSLYKILFQKEISVADVQKNRFEFLRAFSNQYPHVTLMLKGANMLIVQDGKVYINSMGSSRLSKGGSGDVLTGLITALLAQGYTGTDATIQASLALVSASSNYPGASYAMLPTDIIDEISKLQEYNDEC